MNRATKSEGGFTVLELLVATGIFMVICAAMFGLLQVAQEKYAIETQMSGSFQEARLGLDQIVRDIDIAGYPSASLFSNTNNSANYALAPFVADPGYPNANCAVGACATPNDHDLIIETSVGVNANGMLTVSWIHYQLQGTILYRGVATKTAGADPVSSTTASGVMTPLVNNVIYNASGALLAQISTDYPSMFPGGVQPPIFSYTCSTPTGPQLCSSAPTPFNQPQYISDVDITVIVQTPQQDMQTQSLKLIELTGRGHRTNSQN